MQDNARRATLGILACLATGALFAFASCGSESGSYGSPDSNDGGPDSLPGNHADPNGDGGGNGNGNGDGDAGGTGDGGAGDGGNFDGGDGGDGGGIKLDAGPPANPVEGENQLPGTTEWMLGNPATQREIEGYASATSVPIGGTIQLFVNTASARYTIEVYRLGWYGGLGGRRVLDAVERDGHVQVTPSPDPDGLIECSWTDPYELAVPSSWVTGAYVAKLKTKDTNKQSYIPFVVRDDVRTATYLVQSSVTTFQAYNNWGGRSLYDFNSEGGVRASRVSFLRPYALGLNPESAAGVGAGELITNLQGAAQTGPMGWEYPMVRFLEREGFDVNYVTNVDVHRDGALVAKHPVFVSMGHDEYWSSKMRDHVEYARDFSATSLAFFSGNVSYWQVRLQPSK
ncbi:MAG TPA: N,N-dimethylformamidase beta subunit family domain-containing protein, partial [Labilithrix sp.]|nr:N,N-dimethylformamidase beta subunit family domain-containing protein [Labilithrix sp.]